MPAEVNPTSGQVLEKTTRTRIVSESQAPDFWTYFEQQDLPAYDHLLYLYLNRDNRCIPYGQYTSHFPTRDGRLVPINDQEAFIQAVQGRFGGGTWRLILKVGKQRKCETRIFTGDGPTLPPPAEAETMQPMPQQPANPNNPFQQPRISDNATLAAHAIDTIAGQEHQAVNLGISMMTTAADTMKRFAARSENGNGADAEDELSKALKTAMIARLTMDPLQQLAQMFSVFREVSGMAGGVSNGNGVDLGKQLEQFRSVATLIRELGMVTGGGGAAPNSTGAAIVNMLPGIVAQGGQIAEHWRAGKEAERETAAMMMQPPPAIPTQARPATAPPAAPPSPPILAQPRPAANGGTIVPPSTEFVELRIMDLFNAPISAEEAASRALEFLHTLSGANAPPEASYVTQFARMGETNLVNMFNARPVLKPATGDMKRLLDFIRAFLKFYAEENVTPGKPN